MFINEMNKIPYIKNTRNLFKNTFYKSFQKPKSIKLKENNDIRIMTYNVYMWNNIYSENFSQQLDSIKTINPDILLLQEATWENEDDVKIKDFKNIGFNHILLVKNDILQNMNYGLILFSKYPIKSKKIMDITLDDMSQHFSCIYANILDLHLFGTHLDVWDSTDKTRIKQLSKIFFEVNKIKDENIIFMGDLNLINKKVLTDEKWQYLCEHDKLRNVETHSDAIEIINNNKFIDSFNFLNESPPSLTCCFDRRIDYIFLKKHFKHKIVDTFIVYNNYSDHLPVIIDIRLNACF